MKYDEPEENEWVRPTQQDYRMMCCDCGLVHHVDFRIVEGKAQFRARRNNRATGQARRWMKEKKENPFSGLAV